MLESFQYFNYLKRI